MKKIISILLCMIMMLSIFNIPALAGSFSIGQKIRVDDTFSMGDINDDGTVNAKDALYMSADILGLEGYDTIRDAADFDADGDVTPKDAYYLKRCLAGLVSASSYDSTKTVYKFTIGGYDISQFSIVVPTGTSSESNIWFAYLNLSQYIRQVTGRTLKVYYGSTSTSKGIYFHDVSMDTPDGQHLGYEGYRYEVTNGNLHIYGSYRGNMYAVYDILEDYLGYRFYSCNETFIYKSRAVDIPEGTSVELIPELDFRYARQTFGDGYVLGHFFPNKLNGSQLSGYDGPFYGTKTGPLYSNAHSFLEYWQMGTGTMPTDDSLALHQKYDAKFKSGEVVDPYSWQPCATSDEEYAILFEGMLDCNRMVMSWGRATYTEEGITVFSFSIADNQNYHSCRNCRVISQGNKTKPAEGYSGLYLQLYNRAAEDVQEYYPGVHLYGIVYAKDFPATIKPHEKLIILYCGIGCNNHLIGSEECYEGGGQLNGSSNDADIVALQFWGNLCKETGAQLWFWIYPVTYHYYLTSCPNVLNIYPNMKWLHEVANVTGFFYEGGGMEYNFETLKEWIAVKFMWDLDMTEEEMHEVIMEYLYMNYGDGNEELYEYIEMQTEAGDQCGTCFINNYDRPGDMYSYEYLAENYEYMRSLLTTALEKAQNNNQKKKIETLIVCCDFMGLSSVHTDWYVNGNNVSLYKERYNWMYNYIKSNNMTVFSSNVYTLPSSINYEINPMIQFYEIGSRRTGIYP